MDVRAKVFVNRDNLIDKLTLEQLDGKYLPFTPEVVRDQLKKLEDGAP